MKRFRVRSHLVADDVDLVLHLRNPLTDDGKQLRDGGLRIHEDLQTGRVIGIEEGERCRQKHPGRVRGETKTRKVREGSEERKGMHIRGNLRVLQLLVLPALQL